MDLINYICNPKNEIVIISNYLSVKLRILFSEGPNKLSIITIFSPAHS